MKKTTSSLKILLKKVVLLVTVIFISHISFGQNVGYFNFNGTGAWSLSYEGASIHNGFGSGNAILSKGTGTYTVVSEGLWADIPADGYSTSLVGAVGNGTFTISAIAPSGDGSSGSPYQIETLEHLQWIYENSGSWDKYFQQIANIDATSTTSWDNGAGFSPIGNSTTNFTGSYDGQNYTIDGLFINRVTSNSIGLFGYVRNYGIAIIKNLGVTNVDITGDHSIGGLVGYLRDAATIENCYSTGIVKALKDGNSGTIGGLVGLNNYGTISKSYSSCDVHSYRVAGGLVGSTSGIVGVVSAVINDCYSRGNVTRVDGGTEANFGAFVGYADADASTTNCYSTGSVTYVSGTADSDKGFIGILHGSNVSTSGNFFDEDVSNQTTGNGATPKTTALMKTQSTFTDAGWDFTNDWDIDEFTNDGYAFLRWQEGVSHIWTGTTDNDWNTNTNWNPNTVPDVSDEVGIPDSPTHDLIIATTDQVSCNNITINSGTTVTIKSDATSTGSLIIAGSATGNITVERYLSANKWHYISAQSNVQGNFNTLGMGLEAGANKDQFYRWEESLTWGGNIGNWVDILNGPNGTDPTLSSEGFVDCKGYAITYKPNDYTLSLSGVPYTSNQKINITRTDNSTGIGSNLVGNPFSSSIAINNNAQATNNFLSQNSAVLDPSFTAVYFWNETNDWSGGDDYTTKNNTDAGEVYAAPGQAFMVISKTEGGVLEFNTSIRKHGTAPFYKNSNNDDAPRVNLMVVDAQNSKNSTAISFLPNMTLGLDPSYDAGKLKGNPNIALYTQLVEDNGVDFAIQALPDNDIENIIIPVGIDVAESTVCEFSINANAMDGFPVYLEDKHENTITNLKETTYSTFISESGYGRFFLHFKEVLGVDESTTTVNLIKVWAANNTINIFNKQNLSGDVKVLNSFGQVVANTKLTGDINQKLTVNLQSGIYIVNITTKKGIVNKKVYLK